MYVFPYIFLLKSYVLYMYLPLLHLLLIFTDVTKFFHICGRFYIVLSGVDSLHSDCEGEGENVV